VHKIAISFGPSLALHWYGVLVAFGFFFGLWTASRRGQKDGFSSETIMDLCPVLLLGGIIGARILYAISYWRESFADQPWYEIFMIQHGGLVYYGGLIGATLSGIVYVKRKALPLWKLADVLAPSIPLGHAFGRVGCLMNGCCYGAPTSLPWAIHFPVDHPTHGHGVHPTQIYESSLNILFYLGLVCLNRRKKFDGQVFAVYLIGYAMLRSFVEVFRGDYEVYYLGGWATPAQLVSVGIITTGLVLFWRLPRVIAVVQPSAEKPSSPTK
jgi:phosphatidylglycerol:prolipoprotein diacylglycerol transferase